ncbi:TIGR03086 family metal-binding protein [Dermatobacter hominis]|uniref:TIGR03086 family metal-binding protein n=1 Tax=Dermatobacter hominis TaxID=2884263 RepID=UPI001D11EDCB|nr:TIGR03086 family metal-binding protein [Dermatobacter hominis]UDY34554.1 TIGR03086 family protein [Dermatobacter hominis]
MTTTTIPFDLDDGVDGGAQLQQVVPRLGAAIASVQPADLGRRTPCAEWTVRDLLNHVIGGAEMFSDAFGGGPVQDISGRLPDVIGDDPTAAFGRAAERFGAATQQPGAMERVLELPFGPMTGRTFLRFVAFDLIVHTWDITTVTGAVVPELPDDLLLEVEAFAHTVLDPLPRVDLLCAAAVDVADDAPPLDRIVAFSGRRP